MVVFAMHEQMEKVLAQAARLQKLVPDAVLVGGSAVYLYAKHRYSLDHDHIVADLIEEITRIKAFLIVKRNQMRDYFDFAALCDRMGISISAQIIEKLDEYYTDDSLESIKTEKPALSQLLRQLCNPQPKDIGSIEQLQDYKGAAEKWKDWNFIVKICRCVAEEILGNGNA